jgi:hypothetical protein
VRKPILLTLVLALSGSSLATDVDDFVTAIGIDGISDNGSLCNGIKVYYPVKQVRCYQTDRPLFMVKDRITSMFAVNNIIRSPNSIVTAYNFGSPALLEKYGGFFELYAHTDTMKPDFRQIGISLDPISKYFTTIVVYSY